MSMSEALALGGKDRWEFGGRTHFGELKMSGTSRSENKFGGNAGGPQVASNKQGFTLVELMIAMTLSLITMGLIYNGYKTQQEAHTNERLTVDMQQNARSTLAFMRREIRMAGCNPWARDGKDNNANGQQDDADVTEWNAVRGFQIVRADQLNFTMDLSINPVTDEPGDGDDLDASENITYGFDLADDPDADGIADSGAAVLGRKDRSDTADPFRPLAFDVHAIAFAYAFDEDGDGALDTYPGVPGGIIVWAFDSDGDGRLDRHLDTNMDGRIDEGDDEGGNTLASAGIADVDRNRVRAVQVWILTRSQVAMRGRSVPAQTFVVGPNHIAANDGFKRCLFNSMITARNPT
jgi:prepilin-type N-terminal cleavage/methylation domain-containing protein